MTTKDFNFKPLKSYGLYFKIAIWIKRIVRIAIRLFILGLLVWAIVTVFKRDEIQYSYSGDGGGFGALLNPVYWLFFWMISSLILIFSLSSAWDNFARANNLVIPKSTSYPPKPGSPVEKMRVPSFKGKRLRVSLFPVIGEFAGHQFGFFTRQYKEGGILRWRERKMDTIMWQQLDKSVPHIIIDSRLNERARRSNLTTHEETPELIHFEGATGDRYFVYTKKGGEISALQLFTPDVLEVLFNLLPYVDIEIQDKTIWFVWRYAVLDDAVAVQFFSGVETFMTEFDKQLASFTV